MGKALKKTIALCSALACISTVTNMYTKESYATVQNVLLGDADNNG